jgi:hypothetical protein
MVCSALALGRLLAEIPVDAEERKMIAAVKAARMRGRLKDAAAARDAPRPNPPLSDMLYPGIPLVSKK